MNDKVTVYLVFATIVSIGAGLLVTYIDFSSIVETIIFPGIPIVVIGYLAYLAFFKK